MSKVTLRGMVTHHVNKKEQLEQVVVHDENSNFKVYILLIKLFDSLTSLCGFLFSWQNVNSYERHSLLTSYFLSLYLIVGQDFMPFIFLSPISGHFLELT